MWLLQEWKSVLQIRVPIQIVVFYVVTSCVAVYRVAEKHAPSIFRLKVEGEESLVV
jgi:hypothetical protein